MNWMWCWGRRWATPSGSKSAPAAKPSSSRCGKACGGPPVGAAMLWGCGKCCWGDGKGVEVYVVAVWLRMVGWCAPLLLVLSTVATLQPRDVTAFAAGCCIHAGGGL